MIAPDMGAIDKLITGVWVVPNGGVFDKRIIISGGLLGDINRDVAITFTDYAKNQLHILDLNLLTQEGQNRGDVNFDGDCKCLLPWPGILQHDCHAAFARSRCKCLAQK